MGAQQGWLVDPESPTGELIGRIALSLSSPMPGSVDASHLAAVVDREIGVFAGNDARLIAAREQRTRALLDFIAALPGDVPQRVRQDMTDAVIRFSRGVFGGPTAMEEIASQIEQSSAYELAELARQCHEIAHAEPGTSFALANQARAYAELLEMAMERLAQLDSKMAAEFRA